MLVKTVLPALGIGALSGLASSGVQKAMGSGLYLKKGECVSQVETDGSGLYLKPYKGKGLQYYGDELYLKQGGKLYDGKGLLLGPNGLFANIPIFGLYLKKGECVSQVETDGSGLYLKPYKGKGLQYYGDELYLKQGGKLYDGKGLLLGPNGLFANIPILGAIL